jgi:hypothetical protein
LSAILLLSLAAYAVLCAVALVVAASYDDTEVGE